MGDIYCVNYPISIWNKLLTLLSVRYIDGLTSTDRQTHAFIIGKVVNHITVPDGNKQGFIRTDYRLATLTRETVT